MKKQGDTDPAINERAREWVRRLASGEMTDGDISTLKAWLAERSVHANAFERERAFWQDLETHREMFVAPAAVLVPPITARHRERRRWTKHRAGKRALAAALAASVVAMLAGPEIALHLRADHLTAAGDIRSIALADGSTAMLDSGSAIDIQYDAGERRIVLLRGRAWFRATHGDSRPFRVVAADGLTEDIGTAFEVALADRDTAHVAVSEGSVRVMAGNNVSGTILLAGQRARYADGTTVRLTSLDADRIAAWRNGELLIDKRPLVEAIAEVGRYRSGPVIVMANLSGRPPVSGVFRTDRPDDALAALAASAKLRLTRLPAGTILIR